MRLKILFLVISTLTQVAYAQNLISKNGHIWFYSHTPMEDIEAHNRQVVSILDPASGDIAFNLLIKSFEFKVALMQEHFNENYMESDKYPKATYKGKITNLDKIDFRKDGIYPAEVTGDLTIHNVTKPVTAKGALEVQGGTVTARAKLILKPQDYNIAIPSVVENKIAKEIEVSIDIQYSSK
jgi:hypothetical protein